MQRNRQENAACALFSTSVDDVFSVSSNGNLGIPPVWIDTDVGFDDLVAIGCCYDATGDTSNNKEKNANVLEITKGNTASEQTRLVGISTVRGGLTPDPSDGVAILRGLLEGTTEGPNTIPIVAGTREEDLSVRCQEQMKEFCSDEGISLSTTLYHDKRSSETSDDKIFHSTRPEIFETETKRDRTDDSSVDKMDLVCLGPLTNLAQWLEEIPERSTIRLNSIWILGGNIPIRQSSSKSLAFMDDDGNHSLEETKVEAEFNFSRDPEAVQTVLHHPTLQNTTIHIVPQEVCNRKAFEGSFFPKENKCAAEIIENWLQSTLQEAPMLEDERLENTNDSTSVSVEMLLPPWMVHLIRKRTFSVYGDPICMYARHLSEQIANREKSETNSIDINRQPKLTWKEYGSSDSATTSTSSNGFLAVDSEGRLIIYENETSEKTASKLQPTTAFTSKSEMGGKRQYEEKAKLGNTIRMAQAVELGQDYLDWLARSLISSFRKPGC